MKFIIIILMLVQSAVASAQVKLNKAFTLAGKVIGQDTGYVHLEYLDGLNAYIMDSCHLRKGAFEFSGTIAEPCLAAFYVNAKPRSVDDLNFTDLFIEPGKMQAVFTVGNFKNLVITGSGSHKEFATYNNRYKNLRAKWNTVFDDLDIARSKNDTTKTEFIVNNQLPLYYKENDSLRFSFIKQYPGSYVSAYLLNYRTHELTIDSLKMFYFSLASTVQQSGDGKAIESYLTKEENLLIGKQAPDFTKTDADGNTISLSDFRGKYVLLDFWASWCVPCREEHPYLKKAYAKFQDKGFTIVSFSLDRLEEKDAWKDAIKQDSLPWTQLCDFKAWRGEVVNAYNLSGKGIPGSFLINPEGQIIAKDLRGDAIEKMLSGLLK